MVFWSGGLEGLRLASFAVEEGLGAFFLQQEDWPIESCTPALSEAANISYTSTSFMAIRFSTSTWLPAAAHKVKGRCRWCGRQCTAASTDGLARACS